MTQKYSNKLYCLSLLSSARVLSILLLFSSLLFLSSLLLFSSISSAVVVVRGTTYEIIEPDLLLEIEKKAQQVNWQKLQKDITLTQHITHLPIATQDKSYYHTPTTRLPFAVKDRSGKILYPQGFKFNPLKYISLPNQLIVLGSVNHLKMLSSISELVSLDDTLLIANMDTRAFIKQADRQAFLLTRDATKRLGIKSIPAIISQQGDRFLIQEYAPTVERLSSHKHEPKIKKLSIQKHQPRDSR